LSCVAVSLTKQPFPYGNPDYAAEFLIINGNLKWHWITGFLEYRICFTYKIYRSVSHFEIRLCLTSDYKGARFIIEIAFKNAFQMYMESQTCEIIQMCRV
jgi:hypothetical protein